jgi:two-component sensor histidine kinase
VVSIADSTHQGSKSVDKFMRSLKDRIQAMATAHSLLSQSSWQSIRLETLVWAQLAPYTTKENTTVRGTDVKLTAAAAQAIAMVLHELVTNAAKHGALSIADGQVSVTWDCRTDTADASKLRLAWRELGGPRVAPSIQSSYGTGLIRNLIPHELGGDVDLVFAPDGVCCTIDIPLKQAERSGGKF